jgi:hypothetical protein
VLAIRKEVRRVFCEEEDDARAAHICGYTMQENLFAVLQVDSEGITWKSYLWNLPRGVLKFALHASIDTLPIFTNLKKWAKRAYVNCHLCGNTVKQTFSMFLFIVYFVEDLTVEGKALFFLVFDFVFPLFICAISIVED